MSVKVTEFELVDHGIDAPSYFQGCGTTFTSFHHCVTGAGDNPAEALNDALEQAAMGEPSIDAEDLYNRIMEEEKDNPALVEDEDGKKGFPEEPSAWENMLKANGITEPDRDEFDLEYDDPDEAQEKYDEAMEAYEEACEEFNDCESNMYYISIRYNVMNDKHE